jgi:serine/alanine adding enzyme
MKYKTVTKLAKNRWSAFVGNHTNGNIFQTPEMYEVYQKTKNYEPIFLAVTDNDDIILGVMLAVIQKGYGGIIGNLTARSIIFGGPLIKNNDAEVLNLILKEYNDIAKSKAIYSQFRNFWDWQESKSVFQKNGFEYEEHLNILVDLNKSEDELWKDVHSKRRNEIRRATKEGTIFLVKNDLESLRECYAILTSVYTRAKLPIPTFDFFKNIFEVSKPQFGLKLFCAENEGEIIGCLLALTYKDSIYDFYAGAYLEHYKKYPNDLIPWKIFLWGKENNYKYFDFGGAGKPNVPYGVRDYKKKFGGELVNYGRFEKTHKPILLKMAKIGFMFWKKLKR